MSFIKDISYPELRCCFNCKWYSKPSPRLRTCFCKLLQERTRVVADCDLFNNKLEAEGNES